MVTVFSIIAVLQVLAGYVCAKGIYCITKMTWLSVAVVLLSITAPLSFGVIRNSLKCYWLIDLICNIGYIYLGFILYFSIFCVFAFIIYKLNSGIDLQRVLSGGLIVVLLILLAGYINALNPRLKKIKIPYNHNLKICFVSDIHVGSINTITTLEKVSALIEQANPDVIILGGDIIDMRGLRNYCDEFVNIMQKITSKYRTYAVIGNHEIYTGAQDCINLMKKAGISMLLDSCVAFGNLNIIGRLDETVYRRKSLQEIMPAGLENTLVVDHSPGSIDESVKNKVFLHLSGHTHGGQIFPLNFLTSFLYKPTAVLDKDCDTYFYISTGAGFWGPPYRIGNVPEVVLIELGK